MHPTGDFRFSEGLAGIRINGLYGYIDTSGKVAIRPQFSAAFSFKGGLARVELPGSTNVGFIDKNGAIVIPAQFASGSDFSEGLAAVQFGSFDAAFIDTTGKVVTPHFAEVWDFSGGLAPVEEWTPPQRPRNGFIDKTGKLVIPARFDSIVVNQGPAFSEGLAIVGVGQAGLAKFGYVDTAGIMVIPPQFDSAGPFHEGLAAVSMGDKQGYIDTAGKWAFPPQYDRTYPFSGGLARVALSTSPTHDVFIDKTGKTVIVPPATWEPVDEFVEGLARVQSGQTVGYIDVTGNLVIPIQFDRGGNFSDGFALVSNMGKLGAINRSGQVVIPLQFVE